MYIIIQHIDTLPKYGKKALDIRNVYSTMYVSYTCKL